MYWDKTWSERIVDKNSVKMNTEKLEYLIAILSTLPRYTSLRKADIGCGTGMHALRMRKIFRGWDGNWTGFDLAQSAIDWAKSHGLNAHCADFSSFDHQDKYDLFLFLDSLEHIEDEDAVVETIKRTGNKGFRIFGNIPLYLSSHDGGFERAMNIEVLMKFLFKCGCADLWQQIYGVKGYPYMVFEAK